MIIPKEEVALTPEEFAAQQAETRRATAEGQYVIILEDSKRMQAKITDGEAIIDAQEDTKKKNLEAIEKSTAILTDLQTKIGEESALLAKATTNRKSAEASHTDFLETSGKENAQIVENIAELNKSHELSKSQKADELKALEDAKLPIIEETKTVSANLEALKKQEIDATDAADRAEQRHKNALGDIEQANDAIEHLKNVSIAWDDANKTKKIKSDALDTEISAKTDASKKLDTDILEKAAELKGLESRAFAVVTREDLLAQKEAFIKQQYIRAGIPWTE